MSNNENLKQEFLAYNAIKSKEFAKTASSGIKKYANNYLTKIIIFECMDGRVNFPLSADLPFGVISSFRSMGGVFDMGIPYFAKTLGSIVRATLLEGCDCLLVVTYHFSKNNKHNGCKGHCYNTEAAIVCAEKFCAELKEAFSFERNKVHPIVIGIETDEDRFIVSEKSSLEKLPRSVRKDLDFILSENMRHSEKLPKRTEKEMQHGESVIAVGVGFDWIHSYNRALIIGPWCYDLDTPIVTAAEIVLSNLKEGRINESDGMLLLCGAVPSEITYSGLSLAKQEAKTLSDHCLKIIELRVPEIMPHLHVLSGTTIDSKRFIPI